jgi:hypothetical protein
VSTSSNSAKAVQFRRIARAFRFHGGSGIKKFAGDKHGLPSLADLGAVGQGRGKNDGKGLAIPNLPRPPQR